ncbi:MAG: sulfite exporter TauE/SafE family protein [Bacteroidales bacterium]|nr:sulfite exporter TauE/SafE family protein [Bacteroidales bacterium]MBK9358289.1 sulfite exporter TauE/SafE family protein [Bacteroidales bacterium]
MMFLWTAFLVGLVGSAHCAGMCGPIALALPLRSDNWTRRVAGGLIYNTGRVLTYMILGFIFGLLGKGLHMAGFQLWTSVVVGTLMISFVVIPLLFRKLPSVDNLFEGFSARLMGGFRKLFSNSSYTSLFGIGLLNGILPCGLVYVAVAGALNTGDVVQGMLYMALFGAGTIPVMLAVSLAGTMISLKLRVLINKMSPYVIVILGVLIILRGLSLGIPYISPKAEALTPVVEKAHSCCHPK